MVTKLQSVQFNVTSRKQDRLTVQGLVNFAN